MSAVAHSVVIHPKMMDSLSVGNDSLFCFKIEGKKYLLSQAEMN
jgi:hypothetical protein